VLGSEDTYAGKSFLTPDLYGKDFRFGSPHVTITADATFPGGLGSFFYDDEGFRLNARPWLMLASSKTI
jgi:TldD protein